MKTHAKTMRKALSVVLTLAILMSVCAVMLSTFATAYTVNGESGVTETKTYVYNFIDDATGASAYDNSNTDKNANGAVSADENGLLATMPKTMEHTNGSSLNDGGEWIYDQYCFALKLKDNDVKLGDDSGHLKFEADTDYAISIKFKIILSEGETVPISKVRLMPACYLSGRYVTTKFVMYGPGGYTKYSTSSPDGWYYVNYDVNGSNACKRGSTSFDTAGKELWILMGHNGDDSFTNLQILIESVTVTVKHCDADCAINNASSDSDPGAEFAFVAEKDKDGNVKNVRAVLTGDTIVPSNQHLEFYDNTTGVVTTGTTAANQTALYSYYVRNKTEMIEYDMTTAAAADAYSSILASQYAHTYVANAQGTSGGNTITSAGGKASHLEQGKGFYFTSSYTAWSSATGYVDTHETVIMGSANAYGKDAYLRVLAGKTYYIDVAFKLIRDTYSTSTTPQIALGVWNGSCQSHHFDRYNIDATNTTSLQHVTATVDGDGVCGTTNFAGNNITITVNNNTTVLIEKVTVYVCDKNVQSGDEVFQFFDGKIEKKVAGAILVDPKPISVSGQLLSSIGWADEDGNPVETVEAEHMSKYSAKYNATIITFDKGKGILGHRVTIWAYEKGYVPDGKGGLAYSIKNTSSGQDAYIAIGANDDTELNVLSRDDYNFVNGKKYSLTFKYKVKAGYIYGNDTKSKQHLQVAYTDLDGNEMPGPMVNPGSTIINETSRTSFVPAFVVDSTNGTDNGDGTYALNQDSEWITETYTITWDSSKGDALLFCFYNNRVGNGIVFDDIVIYAEDDIMNNTNENVASGIRAEKNDGESYISAGIRFRARLSDDNVGASCEIGFIATPQEYADANSDWYLMDATTGAVLDDSGMVRASWCKHLAHNKNQVYTDVSGYNEYQVILTGLTAQGATNNAKANDVAVVFFYRLKEEYRGAGDDGYRYNFVRSSSYNEVKQMLADAGYDVVGY